jgi:hypothetical protein
MEEAVAGFDGKSFLLALQSLDLERKRAYGRHGKFVSPKWTFVEHMLDDAMLEAYVNGEPEQ